MSYTYCNVPGCQGRVYARGLCRRCYEYIKKSDTPLPPVGTKGRKNVIELWPEWAEDLPVRPEEEQAFVNTIAWMTKMSPPEEDRPAQPSLAGAAGHVLGPKLEVTPVPVEPKEDEDQGEDELDAMERAWRYALGDINPNDHSTVLSCLCMRVVQNMDESGLTELAALTLALLPEDTEDPNEDG